MIDPSKSNNSFIPKQGTPKRVRRTMTRQIYLFTLISYVLVFSTLLATGGVFLYNQYTTKKYDQAVGDLNREIASFKQADMEQVKDFDRRLSQISGRVEAGASIVSILSVLEASTVDTVQIETLSLSRELDDKYLLEASILTDSFDSTIFQRGVLNRNEQVANVSFSELNTSISAGNNNRDNNSFSGYPTQVSFKAEIEVPVSAVPYIGRDNPEADNNFELLTNEQVSETNQLDI
jgi:hypothetical protein